MPRRCINFLDCASKKKKKKITVGTLACYVGACVKACVATKEKGRHGRGKERERAKSESERKYRRELEEESENKGERLNVATTCNFAKYQNDRTR